MYIHKTYKHPQKKGNCNHQDHNLWSRRSFLQALGLAGGGTMMLANTPLAVAGPSVLSTALSQAENDRILLLIRLKGGNDGLNTVIPINQYDVYANNRNVLRINTSDYFNLSDAYGMPDFMSSLQSLWQEGQMKVVHGVGYDNMSLSHFTGSDIIAAAQTEGTLETGWLGRYFQEILPDYTTNPPEVPPAVEIGYNATNLTSKGTETNYALHFIDPGQLQSVAQTGNLYTLDNLPEGTYGQQLGALRLVANNLFNYAGAIHNAYEAGGVNDVEYDANNFATQLSILARLIKGHLGAKIYLVTIGGFDTHANQKNTHEILLNTVSNAVADFYEDLAASGLQNNVVAMTFSEFGRRVQENGSQGTDHGTATPTLFFGPALGGNGFIGEHPSLTDLDATGNMLHTVDFRSVYHTVMTEWLCIDEAVVNTVLGSYETLPIFDPNGAVKEPDHFVTYLNGAPTIHYETTAGHVILRIFDTSGKNIKTFDNFVLGGIQQVDVKATLGIVNSGIYIYRISTPTHTLAAKFIVQ